MRISARLKIFPSSDTAGVRRLRSPVDVSRLLRGAIASITIKIAMLAVIFVVLPVILYSQFESADHQTRDLAVRSIQDRSFLIAQALKPVLERVGPEDFFRLGAELRRLSVPGTDLHLMLQPAGAPKGSFYYVASAPQIEPSQLTNQLDALRRYGAMDQLSESCRSEEQRQIRYKQSDGREEILTSIFPVRAQAGCWMLVSSHTTSEYVDTSMGRPFWKTPAVRWAALIYLIGAALAAYIVFSVWQHMRHFRDVAREMRQGGVGQSSFASRAMVPEFRSVARDFDRLVIDLNEIAREILRSVEDHAHSLKGPVATIESALEPVRRFVHPEDERAQRALTLIDSAMGKLKMLIIEAQTPAVTVVEPARSASNLTVVVAQTLLQNREAMEAKGIRVVRRLAENVIIYAGEGVLETIVENIVDNAVSFSPPDGVITVALAEDNQMADLKIEDVGPGVEDEIVGHIFDRYFSARPRDDERYGREGSNGGHAGLGLWIVRKYVLELGGTVTAKNCVGGGLSVHVRLPLRGRRGPNIF